MRENLNTKIQRAITIIKKMGRIVHNGNKSV